MTNTPTLAQLIKQAIEQRLLDVHTAFIGRIERYDHKTQRADIEPVLKQTLTDQKGLLKQEALPLLIDVPIIFPRAGNYFLSLPVQKNDFVQVIINQQSLDNFLAESDTQANSQRRFTLQGAAAILGIAPDSRPISSAHKTNLVMGKDNAVQIHIDGNQIRLGSEKADEAIALASKVKAELDDIKSAFRSHGHPQHNTPTTTQVSPTRNLATKKVVAQ